MSSIISNDTVYNIISKDENYSIIESKNVLNVTYNISGSDAIDMDLICGENINQNRVVVLQNGKIYIADNTNLNHIGCVIGISLQASEMNGIIKVRTFGFYENSSFNFTPNRLLYFDNTGTLTQTVQTEGFLQSVGIATMNNKIAIKILDILIN